MTLQFVPRPQGMQHPNILLYGPPKTGKTTGACSSGLGTLLLNADLPNASFYARSQDTEGRIMEAHVEGLATLIDTITTLKAGENIAEAIVLDTVGETHRRLLEEASSRAVRPTMQQYGDTSVHLERFCRALCELPILTVLVCHEFVSKDEESGRMERLPWTGTTNTALGMKLMGMVDVVGYTGVVERDDGTTEYGAQLIHQGGRRGGTRFSMLGPYQPLNLESWLEAINNTSQEALNV